MKNFLKLIALCLILTSCFAANKDGSNNDKNTLHAPLSGEISTLDPADSYDTISATIVYQGYEQLFEYHYLKRPYTLKPLLAKEMPQLSNDGKTYTIKIKEDVRYHDHPAFEGEPRYVKAQDFITQIKRLAYLPTKSNGWWLFDEKIKGLNEFREKVGDDLEKFEKLKVEGLEAPDEHTLKIHLNVPYPQMLYALTMSFTSPMPMEVVMAEKNFLHDKIVGTGPYKLTQWDRGSKLIMEQFKHYRGGVYPSQGDRLANSRGLLEDAGKEIPFLDKLSFHIIKEDQTRWLNFMNKKVSYLDIPKDNYSSAIDPSGDIKRELKKKNVQLQVVPTLTYWWLSFNMKDPVVGGKENLLLRKAIAHAINIDRYINVFTNNIGQKANSIYPPGIPGYDPATKLPYGYNMKKAKEYLKKAGHPEGKGLPTLTFDVRASNAASRQRAEFIKRQLEKIGIDVKTVLNTFPAFLKKSRNGQLQFWLDGWSLDYPDAENVLQLLITKNHAPGPNATNYSNPKFDKLFNELKYLSGGKEKFELMKKMENIVHQDLPWVMLYYSRDYILYHNYLKNYRPSDIIYNNMKYLRVKK